MKLKSIAQTCKIHKIATAHLFSEYIKSKGIEVLNYQNLTTSNQNIFEIIDIEEKAYWLGFLYADGSITTRNKEATNYRLELGLKESDYNHICKFKKFMNASNKISFKQNKLGNSYRIAIGEKKLTNDLINKGCTPRKSLTLQFPDYDIVPKLLMKHFIRGYMDGDGWIGLRKIYNGYRGRCSIVGTEDFIRGCCKELNFECKTKQLRKKGKAYQYEFLTNECEILLSVLYENANVYLDRKFEIYLKICPPNQKWLGN